MALDKAVLAGRIGEVESALVQPHIQNLVLDRVGMIDYRYPAGSAAEVVELPQLRALLDGIKSRGPMGKSTTATPAVIMIDTPSEFASAETWELFAESLKGRPADNPAVARAQTRADQMLALHAQHGGSVRKVNRALNNSEPMTTAQLNADFAADGYRIPALLRRIATGDAFFAAAAPEGEGR